MSGLGARDPGAPDDDPIPLWQLDDDALLALIVKAMPPPGLDPERRRPTMEEAAEYVAGIARRHEANERERLLRRARREPGFRGRLRLVVRRRLQRELFGRRA